jgi:hypothetical protein
MDVLNRDEEARFSAFLSHMVGDPARHGRFLNTLSLLEHIGSRKIMLSHLKGGLGKEGLKHMAEESRHAYFFCKEAERYLGHAVEDYSASNTLSLGAAKMYFGRLDAAVTKAVQHLAQNASYLWVSLIVELRANWAYALYQKTLNENGISLSLKSIMAEENLHLAEMYESVAALDADAQKRIAVLAAQEHTLFRRFWPQMQQAATYHQG